MADRYWVGGAGAWTNTDAEHWAASSGGMAGASAPEPGDTVFFDIASGSGTVTIQSITGSTVNAAAFAGAFVIDVGAALVLMAGVVHTASILTGPDSSPDKNHALLQSSVSGSRASLSDSGGVNTLNYMTVTDIAFTGGAAWQPGVNFIDGGNNAGLSAAAASAAVAPALFFGVAA